MEYNQYNLKKWLEKPDLTEADRQWLLNYLERTGNEEVKKIAEDFFYEEVKSNTAVAPEDSLRLLNNLHQQQALNSSESTHSFLRRRWIWLSAASVIAVLIVLGFFWKPTGPNSRQLAQKAGKSLQQESVITPGRDGAILTLSDGTTILLDSAHNGTLTADLGAAIVKQGSRLEYKGDKGVGATINTMVTPKGRQFQLILADGTRAWLNAASSIRFPTVFSENKRVVEVTGEVYFEVAKNTSMPFVVKSAHTYVEVLGTHFNINSYDNAVQTTLLEGSVKIKQGNTADLLKPGQQAQSFENGEIRISNRVDMEQVMAWKNGRFVFENANLKAIMDQVSRWYDVEVLYEEGLPLRTFSADISRSTLLVDFLKVLEVSGVRYTLEGHQLTVKNK